MLVNLGYSSLLQLIAIQKGHVRLITLYNIIKVNRVYGTMKKKDIYLELLAFNSQLGRLTVLKKVVSLQNIKS